MKLSSALIPAFLAPLLVACVVSVGSSSCQHTIVGSGTEVSEARGLPEFSQIEVGGAAHVVASIGAETAVVVTCDDNLVEYVLTEVRGDTLKVSMQSGSYQFETRLLVTVVSPELVGARVSGAGDLDLSGVDTDHFEARTSGAGSLRVIGRADEIEAQSSGAGSMDLSQLTARTAEVRVSGAGNVAVNARESLSARASGAGSVRFAGAPAVEANVSGAGSVKRE